MKLYEYLDFSFSSFASNKEAWDNLDFQNKLFYLHFWKMSSMKKNVAEECWKDHRGTWSKGPEYLSY